MRRPVVLLALAAGLLATSLLATTFGSGSRAAPSNPARGVIGAAGWDGATCPEAADLERYWPPERSAPIDSAGKDIERFPFSQVQVVAIACGDVRGVGNDAYIAYVLGPAPPLGQAVCTHYCSRLAVLRPGEAHLVNIDELPGFELPSRTGGGFPPSLQIRDVTGDGRGEIIFQGATWRGTMYGGYADDVAVWTWNREAAYQRVFDASGIHFREVAGDGVPAIVLLWSGGASMLDQVLQPPAVLRWRDDAFRPALIPQAYDDLILHTDVAKPLLSPDPGLLPDRVRTSGSLLYGLRARAYAVQARAREARADYDRTWALWRQSEDRLGLAYGTWTSWEATGWVQGGADPAVAAVALYYRQLADTVRLATGPISSFMAPWRDDYGTDSGLPSGAGFQVAYSLLGERMRQEQSFPDFALGFARTTSITLVGEPHVVGQEDDVSLVAMRVRATDQTEAGEVERHFAGTWRVRVHDSVYALESAEMRQE